MAKKRGKGQPRKRRSLSEHEAWLIALDDHPEWRDLLKADKLPDEMIGPTGEPMNPRLHLQIHAIVERQLAADEPQGVVEVARQLAELGIDDHEIRHEIGYVLTQHMWLVLHEQEPFDPQQYLEDLRARVDLHRQS